MRQPDQPRYTRNKYDDTFCHSFDVKIDVGYTLPTHTHTHTLHTTHTHTTHNPHHTHTECPHLVPPSGRGEMHSAVGGVCSAGHEITGDSLHDLQSTVLSSQGTTSLENGLQEVRERRVAVIGNQYSVTVCTENGTVLHDYRWEPATRLVETITCYYYFVLLCPPPLPS